MPTTTQGLVAHELNAEPTLESIQLDDIQPNEALVQIEATGICHTDLSCIDGTLPAEFPNVLGHEGAGTILEAGSELKHLSPGDKVLLSFNHCSKCSECTSSHPAYCHAFGQLNFGGRRADGTQPLSLSNGGKKLYGSFFGQSSFAKVAVIAGASMVKVPSSTRLELFAPLGCGIQTGAGSVLNTLDVQSGQSLAVFGAGSVGLAAIMAGKLRGANPVIAIDLSSERLALAQKLGATHTILASDKNVDVVKEIQGICPPTGVSRAVDCTGAAKVVEQMIQALGSRGKAATVGAPSPGTQVPVDIFNHLMLGRQYVGCCEGDSVPEKLISYLIEQHAAGKFPVDELITFYGGNDYAKAFKGKTIKAVLKWQ
ncbi:hypothetical protein PMZ80_010971 [Knufia obscura]|uniref:Enoyl reductase (ER) domain-containing protein n=1 Tax=Knufia obscura TaxID=1635080 RepID=A0ABR0R894_9EURO|nr:hypothetical protein PMZ80_010971 [Knufia obscura]